MSGLPSDVIETIRGVFIKYPQIDKVLLYGSRAKGCEKRGSDIDLCIFSPFLTEDVLYEIREELEDLPFPYVFDLSVYNQIENKELINHINRVGVIFYKNETLS